MPASLSHWVSSPCLYLLYQCTWVSPPPPPPPFPFGEGRGEGREGRESLPPPPLDPPAEPEGPAAAVHSHCPQHHRIGLLRGYQPS